MKLVKNSSSFDLVIPEEVEAKIRHLCNRVHDVEWSGTLFYKVEGSLDDGTFKVTCVDLFVMDIGTGATTMFKDNEDIIAYRLAHRDTLLVPGIYEGLIHSHNNMPAFFSGTDEDTLISEGTDIHHFLSLVVCNAGKYVARITRKVKTVIEAEALITYNKTIQYSTYEDKVVVLANEAPTQTTQKGKKEEIVIEYFDLNINKSEVPEPFKEVDERLTEIRAFKSKQRYSYSQFQGPYTHFYDRFGQPFEKTDEKTDEKQLSLFEEKEDKKDKEMSKDSFDRTIKSNSSEESIEDPEFYMFEKVPASLVKVLCTQLLCGSILASSKTNINLDDWVMKMDKVYEDRFGKLDEEYNELRIRDWVDSLIEHIIFYSVDKKFEDKIAKKYNLGDDYDYIDSDAFAHLYACDMITYLEDLPESNIKEIMIEELVKIMPPEYEDTFRN